MAALLYKLTAGSNRCWFIDLALRPYRWKGFGPLKLIDSAEPTGPARKILQKLSSCQ